MSLLPALFLRFFVFLNLLSLHNFFSICKYLLVVFIDYGTTYLFLESYDMIVTLIVCFTLQQKWTPVADFTHHAHTASLSAVAVNSRFVVTGSKDETIHIYDMKKKIDHGALVHHNGEKIISFKIMLTCHYFSIWLQLNNSLGVYYVAGSVLENTEMRKMWFFLFLSSSQSILGDRREALHSLWGEWEEVTFHWKLPKMTSDWIVLKEK